MSSTLTRTGIVCVVSGPAGSGKTTLCHRLAEESEECAYSVSCTTRPPREGEVHGEDYYFLTNEEFEQKVADQQLLEYAKVHERYYGTLLGPVLDSIRKGIDVLMDLDIQGAEQLRNCANDEIRRALVDVFILPPSIEEMMNRVQGRGPMAEEELQLRMRNAEREVQDWPKYQYTIVTGEREADFAAIGEILAGERRRSSRLQKGELAGRKWN
ncbi:MAG: guanylate kinase [Verrucomicrobiota bacterium]